MPVIVRWAERDRFGKTTRVLEEEAESVEAAHIAAHAKSSGMWHTNVEIWDNDVFVGRYKMDYNSTPDYYDWPGRVTN